MKEFEDLIAEDGFVEHAKFGGNRYGTSKKMIKQIGATGRIVVLDIEMEVRSFIISFSYYFVFNHDTNPFPQL
jgi:guanylate kinase